MLFWILPLDCLCVGFPYSVEFGVCCGLVFVAGVFSLLFVLVLRLVSGCLGVCLISLGLH